MGRGIIGKGKEVMIPVGTCALCFLGEGLYSIIITYGMLLSGQQSQGHYSGWTRDERPHSCDDIKGILFLPEVHQVKSSPIVVVCR